MMSKEELETPPLEQHLAEIITDLIRQKEEQNRQPAYADSIDILNRLNADARQALNRMIKSGLLTYHRTLNGVAVEFTPPK